VARLHDCPGRVRAWLTVNRILIVLMVVGLALRMWGLFYDLPYGYNGTEPIFTKEALRLAAQRTLQPRSYIYPPLFAYLLLAVYGAAYVLGRLTGLVVSVQQFAFLYLTRPGYFALAGRLLSTTLGILTVFLVYRLGRASFGQKAGLYAAGLMALSPVHVQLSQLATGDVLMTFLAAGSCLLATEYLVRRHPYGTILAAGFIAGLSVAAKYNSGFVILFVLGAYLLRARQKHTAWRQALLTPELLGLGAAVVLGFCAGVPSAIRDWPAILRDLRTNGVYAHVGKVIDSRPAFLWLLEDMGRLELLGGIAMLAGLVYAARRHEPFDLMGLALVVPSLLYVGSFKREGLYYALPAFPILAVWAGRLLADLDRSLLSPSIRPVSLGLLVFVVTAILAFGTVAWRDIKAGFTDTRVLAKAWIESHIPGGTKIAMRTYVYSPPLHSEGADYVTVSAGYEDPKLAQLLSAYSSTVTTYHLYDLVHSSSGVPPQRTFYSVAELKDMGVAYVVLSSYDYWFMVDSNPAHMARIRQLGLEGERAYYQMLLQLPLTYEFAPSRCQSGPRISIFRLQ
jgi:4-amino-4-deoxy-L-arabinose transferase-like glycosyltransferase